MPSRHSHRARTQREPSAGRSCVWPGGGAEPRVQSGGRGARATLLSSSCHPGDVKRDPRDVTALGAERPPACHTAPVLRGRSQLPGGWRCQGLRANEHALRVGKGACLRRRRELHLPPCSARAAASGAGSTSGSAGSSAAARVSGAERSEARGGGPDRQCPSNSGGCRWPSRPGWLVPWLQEGGGRGAQGHSPPLPCKRGGQRRVRPPRSRSTLRDDGPSPAFTAPPPLLPRSSRWYQNIPP